MTATIEPADSALIGRLAGELNWTPHKCLVTIQAHCVAILDETDNPTIRDIAGCISQNVLEIAQALNSGRKE